MKNNFLVDNKICEVIATYKDNETNKNFIIYTDNTYNKDNKLNIYSSLYILKKEGLKLIEIKESSDKITSLNIIKEVIKDIK